MASVCTTTIQKSSNNCLSQASSEQNDRCCVKINSSSTLVIEEVNSPSRVPTKNYTKIYRGTAPRSSNKRFVSSSILMPPPGAYPRIPPFPGVPLPMSSPNMYYPAFPPPPPPPTQPNFSQDFIFSVTPPVIVLNPSFSYQPISESNGYRLMMHVPVGHRVDGTYGILTFVRPDQEYRMSYIYANNVVYYNIPTNIPVINGPSMNVT